MDRRCCQGSDSKRYSPLVYGQGKGHQQQVETNLLSDLSALVVPHLPSGHKLHPGNDLPRNNPNPSRRQDKSIHNPSKSHRINSVLQKTIHVRVELSHDLL